MPSCAGFLEPRRLKLLKSTLRSMLKISCAACRGLYVVNSAQFVLEMCLAAQNRQKIHETSILVFKIIQGHCCQCQSKARVRLFISD